MNESLADPFTHEIDMRPGPEGSLAGLIEDFRRKFEMVAEHPASDFPLAWGIVNSDTNLNLSISYQKEPWLWPQLLSSEILRSRTGMFNDPARKYIWSPTAFLMH